jgi:hypothetical protein
MIFILTLKASLVCIGKKKVSKKTCLHQSAQALLDLSCDNVLPIEMSGLHFGRMYSCGDIYTTFFMLALLLYSNGFVQGSEIGEYDD